MSKYLNILFIPLALIMLCNAITYADDTFEDCVKDIEIKHDDFKKQTKYLTDDIDDDVYIRAWKQDIDRSVTYQIYITNKAGYGFRDFDEAYDANGYKFNIAFNHKSSYQSSGLFSGSYTVFVERIGLNITREYLEAHKESGIIFQIYGRYDEPVKYVIEPNCIKAFLSVVE